LKRKNQGGKSALKSALPLVETEKISSTVAITICRRMMCRFRVTNTSTLMYDYDNVFKDFILYLEKHNGNLFY